MMKKHMYTAATLLLGFLMIVFGLNKFIGFIPVDPPADPSAQQFMGTMFMSYLYVVVALFEIAGGFLLMITKTRLLGWLLLAPVIFNIVAFHVAHDFIGNGIWIIPTALFILISFEHKEKLSMIVKPMVAEHG